MFCTGSQVGRLTLRVLESDPIHEHKEPNGRHPGKVTTNIPKKHDGAIRESTLQDPDITGISRCKLNGTVNPDMTPDSDRTKKPEKHYNLVEEEDHKEAIKQMVEGSENQDPNQDRMDLNMKMANKPQEPAWILVKGKKLKQI